MGKVVGSQEPRDDEKFEEAKELDDMRNAMITELATHTDESYAGKAVDRIFRFFARPGAPGAGSPSGPGSSIGAGSGSKDKKLKRGKDEAFSFPAGLTAALSAAALAVSGVVWSAPVSGAEDAIMSQEYVSVTGLDQLKAQGLDGSGVTIAVIDGNVDLTVPELAGGGADVDVRTTCAKGGVFHGTNTLLALADPIWGWAPKAHFLTYVPDHLIDPTGQEETTSGCEGVQDDMVQRAINDGADIINISASIWSISDYTLVRAAVRGIPIVTGSGNQGEYGDTVMAPFNTVVTVGATDMTGKRSSYSQYGTGLTVMAPADPHTTRVPDADGNLTQIVTGVGGTSTATPMVTGALALAMQKWPDANGNQLVASLIATANRAGPGWDQYYGWGTFNPLALAAQDPSGYSTDNPLMDAVPDGLPTRQEFEDYVNGTVESSSSISQYDEDYVPASASSPASVSPSLGPNLPDAGGGLPGWVVPVGVGVVVVAALVVVLVVVARRPRKAAPAGASFSAPPGMPLSGGVPPGGYPQGQPYPPAQAYPAQPYPPGQQPAPPQGQPWQGPPPQGPGWGQSPAAPPYPPSSSR